MDDRHCLRSRTYIERIHCVQTLNGIRRSFVRDFIFYETTRPDIYDPFWGDILWEARCVPTLKYFCIDYCWDMVEAIDKRILNLNGIIEDYDIYRRYRLRNEIN